MTKTYDANRAQSLVTLLRSITDEIRDRKRMLRNLERQRRALGKVGNDKELSMVLSELSIQKRELRHCHCELERLGCTLEEGLSPRVLIPGPAGSDLPGFTWTVSSQTLEECQPQDVH